MGIDCDACAHKKVCVIEMANGTFSTCYEGLEIPDREKFTDRMREFSKIKDPEVRHMNMDVLMANTLRSLGYHFGIDIYEKTEKWYA